MNANETLKLFEELDDLEQTESYIEKHQRRKFYPPRNPKKLPEHDQKFISKQDDSRANFEFTYKASRHEAGWLLESLGMFYEQKWISDVLRQIKGGKEASVYLCKPGTAIDAPPYLAAKVYRPRQFRNLKNDSQYRVGRDELDESGNVIVDDGALYAISKRTAFGEKLRHQSWITYEYQTMQILDEAGADAPKPYAMGNNAILMEYIGDLDMAAPPLQSLELEPAEAKRLFQRTLINVDLMLGRKRIHGDLSAYNILYWDGNIKLIDFPQVVSPDSNPAAWTIFLRDVTRICEYFAMQDIRTDPYVIATDLWRTHGYRVRKEIHPMYLDADSNEDRTLWDKQNSR